VAKPGLISGAWRVASLQSQITYYIIIYAYLLKRTYQLNVGRHDSQ